LAFESQQAIKTQVLADFLAKITMLAEEGNLHPRPWNSYVDGLSTKDGSGADLIIESPTRYGTSTL